MRKRFADTKALIARVVSIDPQSEEKTYLGLLVESMNDRLENHGLETIETEIRTKIADMSACIPDAKNKDIWQFVHQFGWLSV